jgi:hypothetical protein
MQDVPCPGPRPLPVAPELWRAAGSAGLGAARSLDARSVADALRRLKAGSGTHSPSVAELERALPSVVQVDACFLSNPYATDAVMTRLRAIAPQRLGGLAAHEELMQFVAGTHGRVRQCW